MSKDISVIKLMAVYQAVNDNVIIWDDPSKYLNTLQEMFDCYVKHGFDDLVESRRITVVNHYRNMEQFLKDIELL